MEQQTPLMPSDDEIFGRLKDWAEFFARIVSEEDHEEIYFDELPSTDEFGPEESIESDSDLGRNNCGALVKLNNFEGSSSSDEYDMEKLLTEALPVIEERKRKWKESGMDKVLNTFDLNVIIDKVGPWLKAAKLQGNISNSSLEDAQIVLYENHQIHLNSNDSLQSADTAKYVVSKRKTRAASCTTMTIHKYSYVKGKENKKSSSDVKKKIVDVFNNKLTELQSAFKSKSVSREKCEQPVRPRSASSPIKTVRRNVRDIARVSLPKVSSPKSKPESLRIQESRRRRKRSEIARKRSDSSSSSSDSPSKCDNLHRKPKFKKKLKKINESLDCVDLTAIASSSSDIDKGFVSPVTTANKHAKLPLPSQSSNTTCFLPENVTNSTALSNSQVDSQANAKNCQLSQVVNKSQVQDTTGLDRKILLYTPGNRAPHRKTTSSSFELTEECLRKSIGKKAARRFITVNQQKFPFKFDSSSTVYFQLPTESENSHQSGSDDDSEEDILVMFGKQGDLVEQTTAGVK